MIDQPAQMTRNEAYQILPDRLSTPQMLSVSTWSLPLLSQPTDTDPYQHNPITSSNKKTLSDLTPESVFDLEFELPLGLVVTEGEVVQMTLGGHLLGQLHRRLLYQHHCGHLQTMLRMPGAHLVNG